jgi:chain length determinant protein tyrosine kinase EpsG
MRIGEVLVGLGRLDESQVLAVLAHQESQDRRFGEIALLLGFVARGDLDLALARQRSTYDDVLLEFPRSAMVPELDPDEFGSEALVAVRSQLVHRWFGEDPEQRSLAIVSPDAGDGRSYVCSRLGRLFAELEEDTLLIDADLRNPTLHEIFHADNSVGLSSYLQGDVTQPPVRAVPGIPYLHLLCAGPAVEHPHRLLARNEFARLLETLCGQFRAVLVDTPPASRGPDAMTVALRASGALLVVRKHEARISDVRDLAQRLRDSTVEVVGAVLNQLP